MTVDLTLPPTVPAPLAPRAGHLGSNENPEPPDAHVRAVAARALGDLNRYPDRFPGRLVDRLAALHGVPASHVVTGCGAVAVAAHLVQAHARTGDEVVFPWRSFDAYPRLARTSAATAVPVPLRDGALDLAAMQAALTPRSRVVFVCNPNNPTGSAVRRAELEEFLQAVPADTLVVLDEAYRDFVDDPDVPDGVDLLARYPNVAVLRTLSKAQGLAALRIGYSLAAEHISAPTRDCAIPFSVTAVAEAAALATLDDPEPVRQQVRTLIRERSRLRAGLRSIGMPVPASQGNFLWLPFGEASEDFERHCAAHDLRVRTYPGEGVRVTIGHRSANDVVARLAAHLWTARRPARP